MSSIIRYSIRRLYKIYIFIRITELVYVIMKLLVLYSFIKTHFIIRNKNLSDCIRSYKLFNIISTFILSPWQMVLLDITIPIWCNDFIQCFATLLANKKCPIIICKRFDY